MAAIFGKIGLKVGVAVSKLDPPPQKKKKKLDPTMTMKKIGS